MSVTTADLSEFGQLKGVFNLSKFEHFLADHYGRELIVCDPAAKNILFAHTPTVCFISFFLQVVAVVFSSKDFGGFRDSTIWKLVIDQLRTFEKLNIIEVFLSLPFASFNGSCVVSKSVANTHLTVNVQAPTVESSRAVFSNCQSE